MPAPPPRGAARPRLPVAAFGALLLALVVLAQAAAQPSSTCHDDPPTLAGNENSEIDLEGTSGDDIIDGRGGEDVIDGRGGADCIRGGEGNDDLNGGDGGDNILGGPGGDNISGGPGNDRAEYFDHNDPVTVTQDGVSNDGTGGEADNVQQDVEQIDGGNGPNNITGSAVANRLRGSTSADVLDGRDGNDVLTAVFGIDTLRGGNGNDTLDPGASAGDVALGQSGADTLLMRDAERDARADCGPFPTRFRPDISDPGDTAELDLKDGGDNPPSTSIPTPGCEVVKIEPVNEKPNVSISPRSVELSPEGEAPVRMACPRSLASACAGRLRIRTVRELQLSARRRVSLGSRRYRIAPGKKKLVRVHLSRGKRRLVRRLRRVRVQAKTVEKGKRGPKTTIATFLLRAPR